MQQYFSKEYTRMLLQFLQFIHFSKSNVKRCCTPYSVNTEIFKIEILNK